jgi:hypothetical protein
VSSGLRDESHDIWLEWRRINDIAKGARGEAGRDIDYGPADLEVDDANILALNQRNALFDDPEVKTETGRYTEVKVKGELVSVFSQKLAELELGWTKEQKEYVLLNSNLDPIPLNILGRIPKVQKESIIASQSARERYLRNQGLSDIVMMYRAMFTLER